MDQNQRDIYLRDAKNNLHLTFDLILKESEKMKNSIKEIEKSLKDCKEDEKNVQNKLLNHSTKMLNELD